MDATGASASSGLHAEFDMNEDAPHAEARHPESADDAADEREWCSNDVVGASSSSDPRHRVEQTFPNKLHYMLDHGLEESERDVITWQPHGRAFLVVDQRRFVDELLPNWFRQNKYQSFQRQLNSYGFQRITQGQDKGAYYHMSFVRGRRELCRNIRRVKIKGNGGRKPSNPETEPNFYLFPPTLPPPSPGTSGGTNASTKGPEAGAGHGSSRIEGGLVASLFPSLSAGVSDQPLAQLLSMGVPIQNAFPLSSRTAHVGGEGKPMMQDLSLLSFLSSVKNSSQPPSQTSTGSTPSQLPHSAALSGAPYILTSTLGTSPPAPAFASAVVDAAASESLQRSLLQQYSRRLEEEAQARERDQILAYLLKGALPPSAAAPAPPSAPPTSAFAGGGGDAAMLPTAPAAASPARSAPPPPPPPSSSSVATSLMQALLQGHQQQLPNQNLQDRGWQGKGAASHVNEKQGDRRGA